MKDEQNEMKDVSISTLKDVVGKILSRLVELKPDPVEIADYDEYWDIQEPSLRYSGQRPSPEALSDKSLSKDWKIIQKIQNNPKEHLKNLVEASNLLRGIADHLNVILDRGKGEA